MNNEMWLIWKEPKTRRRYKIGTLNYNNDIYTFKYIDPELNNAILNGFNFFPGFEDIHKEYTSKNLFTNIETRLPNPKRPDYLEILNTYGLEKDSSKLEILKATRGRLITDNYEFIKAFDNTKIEFDIAGTRYQNDIKKCLDLININDKLELVLDKENNFDEYAIKVILNKNNKSYQLGYVPRYYSKELSNLLANNKQYSAMIKSLNIESEFNDEDITVLVKLIF